MSPLNLAYAPLGQRVAHTQKVLFRSTRDTKHVCLSAAIAKIAAYSFTSSSGEAINFFQEGDVWKAKVAGPVEGVRVLPVACGEEKQLFPILRNLYQQGANLHKHHIHICNSGQDAIVFLGSLELKGGMLEAEEMKPLTLHEAIKAGNVALVNMLLTSGYDPNMADEIGLTPLHWATYCGHLEMVDVLLKEGANPTIADQDGFPPLCCAIEYGHAGIVRLFLAKEMDLNMPIADKTTPLHWAAYAGNLEIVNLLLAAGADPTIADAENCTPLHVAAYRSQTPIIARLLLCNVDINAQDIHGDTFLHNLIADPSISLKERFRGFLEAMQGIEMKQDIALGTLREIMEDYCPELTNEDTKSILAITLDYSQGLDLRLENKDKKSIVAMIREFLAEEKKEETHGLPYEEAVKRLDRHERVGGWILARAQYKSKAQR